MEKDNKGKKMVTMVSTRGKNKDEIIQEVMKNVNHYKQANENPQEEGEEEQTESSTGLTANEEAFNKYMDTLAKKKKQ